MNSGAIAWMLMASTLVLFMTPGVAFFYSGLVRGRNAVNTLMYSFMAMGVASIVWVLWGYSLAFDDANNFGWMGGFAYLGLNGVDSVGSGDIPPLLFAAFQMTFAIITPALITGAIAERFKFTTYMVFLVLWITFVYCPICYWVWGGGWIGSLGAIDFAGGTVVHINAGIAAVVAAYMVGKRRSAGVEPHNVPYVLIGAAILWIGWFGFNAGSALAADGIAVNAFMVTNVSAAVAAVVWSMLSYLHTKRISAVGFASGAIAGLVAITPAAGFVGVMGSLAIGLGAGLLCYYAVYYRILHRFGIDDSLEVFAVHGIGGIWGALATGVFAVAVVGGVSGLVEGNIVPLGVNVVAVLATILYSGVVTAIILLILKVVPGLGLRVPDREEETGLDVSLHGERGYVSDGAD